MGALVAVGQIDVHIDAGHGVLGALELVQNHDGVGDILDPHLVDVDGPGADVVLDVGEVQRDYSGGFISFHGF